MRSNTALIVYEPLMVFVGSLRKSGLAEPPKFRQSSTMIVKAESALLAQKQQAKPSNRPLKTKAGQRQNGNSSLSLSFVHRTKSNPSCQGLSYTCALNLSAVLRSSNIYDPFQRTNLWSIYSVTSCDTSTIAQEYTFRILMKTEMSSGLPWSNRLTMY